MILFHCRNCKLEDTPDKVIVKPGISNGVEYPGFESRYCPRCKCSGLETKEVFSYEDHIFNR